METSDLVMAPELMAASDLMEMRSGFAKARAGKRANAMMDFILSCVMEQMEEPSELRRLD